MLVMKHQEKGTSAGTSVGIWRRAGGLRGRLRTSIDTGTLKLGFGATEVHGTDLQIDFVDRNLWSGKLRRRQKGSRTRQRAGEE